MRERETEEMMDETKEDFDGVAIEKQVRLEVGLHEGTTL